MALYYFLPAIILLGIITSYQDIKIGKIRNKWIVIALAYSFLINSIILLYYSLQGTLRTHYLAELVTNFLFSISIGFGMWYLGVWTAGDGKLFIAFSALIPLSTYKFGYIEWFPSLTLLINIFIPALIIMAVYMLSKTKPGKLKHVSSLVLKEFFQPKQLFNSVAYLFAIYWIIELFLALINLNNNYFLQLGLTIAVFSMLQNKLGDKTLYIMLLLSVIRLTIDRQIYSVSFLKDFILLIVVWRLLRSFLTGAISKLSQEVFTKTINTDKLKQGMVLSDIIQKKNKITKKELSQLNTVPNMEIVKHKGNYYLKKSKSSIDINNYIEEESEGLTKQQISEIKKIGIKHVKVCQTISFAQFIFLGVILTIIVRGNILIIVRFLFGGVG